MKETPNAWPAPRRAGDADVVAIVALQRAAYARNRILLGAEPLPLVVDYHDIVAWMEVWLFGAGPEPDGVLALEDQRDALLIWSVATAPRAQGGGLGNVMLDFAERRARELGRTTMKLYTGAKLPMNIDWYRRRGYAIERTEDRADRQVVHMQKSLA
jgi:GNAT superfamily N-acetyltransferase